MMADAADDQAYVPGMQLRNRQIRGAVPPVRNQPDNNVAASPLSSIVGSIRRRLFDWFSPPPPTEDGDSDHPPVDGTKAPTSTPAVVTQEPELIPPRLPRSRPTTPPVEEMTRSMPNLSLQDKVPSPVLRRKGDLEAKHNPSIPVHATTEAPPVVNHFHNCTFGSEESNAAPTHRPKLPLFDDTKWDLEAYLANFNAVTRGWTDASKLGLMREKLEGRAGRVLASLDLQEAPVTFDALVLALEQHFVGDRADWMAKLRCISREPDESLDDLAFRLRLYSRRAYGRLQEDLGLQFYLSLRDGPLGDRLYEHKDKDLEFVLKRAKAYESHLLATNQSTTTRLGDVPVAAVHHGSFGNQNEHGFRNMDSSSPYRGRSSGRGGYRGRGFGRGRGGPGGRYGGYDRRRETSERKCYICQDPSHLWRECPNAHGHRRGARHNNGAPSTDDLNA